MSVSELIATLDNEMLGLIDVSDIDDDVKFDDILEIVTVYNVDE